MNSTDKILFEDGKFWGLRNVPKFQDYVDYMDVFGKEAYEKALESCKSNKLEIVNSDEIVYKEYSSNWNVKRTKPKSGDIFGLPEGYGFEEQIESRTLVYTPPGVCYHCLNGVHHNCDYPDTCKCAEGKHNDSAWWKENKVLRLVKLNSAHSYIEGMDLTTEERKYTFPKEKHCEYPDDCQWPLGCSKNCKVSSEESQEKLMDELLLIGSQEGIQEALKHFTIQRKKL